MATSASETPDPAKKMGVKRTTYAPWTSRGLRGSARNTPQQSSPLQQQQKVSSTQPAPSAGGSFPARITSDVLPSTETVSQLQPPPAAMKPSLSGSTRIQSAQAQWERQRNEAGVRAVRADSVSSESSMSVSTESSSESSVQHGTAPPLTAQSESSRPKSRFQLRSHTKHANTKPVPALPDLKPAHVGAGAIPRKRVGEGFDSEPKRAKTAERTAGPVVLQQQHQQQARRSSNAELQQAVDEAMAATEVKLKSLGANTPSEPFVRHKTGGELLAEIKRLTSLNTLSPTKRDLPSTDKVEPEAIVYIPAPENRRYDSFKDSRGASFRYEGAIFPIGYAATKEYPNPWPCPVKGCLSSQPTLESMKGHFSSSHRGKTFHDNKDGTITMVGSYTGANGEAPAIVVSIGTAPSNGAASTPATKGPTGPKATPGSKKVETPVPLPQLGQRVGPDTKRYLAGMLPPSESIPSRADIAWMLQLKKKRDLPDEWISFHKGKKLEPVAMYAIALAYITGDEVTGDGRCKRTGDTSRPTARLSGICVAVPELPANINKVFSPVKTCVGCKYYSTLQRQTNICEWAEAQVADGGVVEVTGGESTEDEMRVSRARNRQRPRQSRLSSETTSGGSEVANGATSSVEQVAMSAAARAASQLEMEDWEFAPGRMTDIDTSETISMSCGHLTGNQPITVAENIGLHDIVIGRGRTHQWHAENDKLRLCYIAAGKVQVKMGGQTFRQGPNSTLVIRPGKTCTLENRFFVDVIVHCTVVDGYNVVDN